MSNILKSSYCEDEDEDLREIGVDEAGRGPMLGRVYAGAVILPKEMTKFNHALMKDSKKFTSEKKIKEVAAYIKTHSIAWAVAYADEREIERINIRNATHQAMHAAIKETLALTAQAQATAGTQAQATAGTQAQATAGTQAQTLLLIDGNDFTPFILEGTTISHICIEGGDNTFSAIAAASILAKVARDEYITELCAIHPILDEHYGLLKNKGYGTKKHMDGIKAHGITSFHRKSFGICRDYAYTQ